MIKKMGHMLATLQTKRICTFPEEGVVVLSALQMLFYHLTVQLFQPNLATNASMALQLAHASIANQE